jgi:hypothetical protein
VLNEQRVRNYAANTPEGEIPAVTAAQRKRMSKKQFGRTIHSHVPGQRCEQCRPRPRRLDPLETRVSADGGKFARS